MKTNKLLLTAIILSPFVCFLSPGCIEKNQVVEEANIASLQADTTVSLNTAVESSPNCKIHLDFMYLKCSDKDSVSQSVNQTLQSIFFNEQLSLLSPEIFVDSVMHTYISKYKNDVEKYYQADIKNGVDAKDIPQWYNYEFDITSELAKGKNNQFWNYTVSTFQNTGGAHPNTWGKWVNINASNGKALTKEDIFLPGTDKDICNLILKQLIQEANKRLETDTISSMEGLQSAGVLLDTDLYIPDNFLLKEEGITFLYNRYDIAPYSMGDFQLTVPYAEIETYLKL